MIVGLTVFVFSVAMFDRGSYFSRYHQHLEWDRDTRTTVDLIEVHTHLPVVMMDTMDDPIPSAGEGEAVNLLTVLSGDNEPLTRTALTHIRGNSSRWFDKKSYAIRLVDEAGNDIETSLLGMESDNSWALHGPYLDRSLIRNYMAYNLAGEIMPYAPDVRFVELYRDKQYEGLYLLMEKVSKGEGRIPLSTPEMNSDQTSYIVLIDRIAKMVFPLQDFLTSTFKVYPSGVELLYPTDSQYSEERERFVLQDFSYISHAIYQIPFAQKHNQYREWIDTQAFYDYFIINELFRNIDAGQYSTYFYRDVRGKLTPVVWDFNNALDNYQDESFDESGFTLTQHVFYERLLMDRDFVRGLIRRYDELRADRLSSERLRQYIDETVAFLDDAIVRNNTRWAQAYDLNAYDPYNYLHPIERNVTDYDAAVDQMKQFLLKRGEWLDDYIDTLYQYSHPSRHGHESIK